MRKKKLPFIYVHFIHLTKKMHEIGNEERYTADLGTVYY
jgi:hypothetical protein